MSDYQNYDIIEEDNFNRLAVHVASLVSDQGWEPIGGVATIIVDGQQYFYQAIALKKNQS